MSENSARVFMYPEVLEQEVHLNLLQRTAFVTVDLGIAAMWATLAGLASNWDYTLMSTTFLGDAALGFLAIPLYSTALLEAMGIYKKKKELQSMANLDGGRYLHVYTGGPKEYTHFFGWPYIAKWMKTRSLVFLTGSRELNNSLNNSDVKLIPISDPHNSYVELQLKIFNEDIGLQKLRIPLIKILHGYEMPLEIQEEWTDAVKNTVIHSRSEFNFTIEAHLHLFNGEKLVLGFVADDLLVKNILSLTKIAKLKKWLINYRTKFIARKKRIYKSKYVWNKWVHKCEALLGLSYVRQDPPGN
ncbi:MAG: hypothetical protein KDD40_03830 [Bdellovibrionales bacterium]|nr:hypothetical protein [Bdellovibrionales bacterium]